MKDDLPGRIPQILAPDCWSHHHCRPSSSLENWMLSCENCSFCDWLCALEFNCAMLLSKIWLVMHANVIIADLPVSCPPTDLPTGRMTTRPSSRSSILPNWMLICYLEGLLVRSCYIPVKSHPPRQFIILRNCQRPVNSELDRITSGIWS